MRRALTLIVALAATLLAFSSSPASVRAQAPGFTGEPEGLVPIGAETGGTVEGTQIGEDRQQGTPGTQRGKLRKKCKTRRGARVCKFYRARIHIKTCKKKPGRDRRCKKFKAGATRTVRSSIATTKNSASPVPASIKNLAGQGYQAPAIPAVGRMYYNGGGWCSGTLIYVGVVLTAGHCIHGAEKGQGYYPAESLQFTPGHYWNGTAAATDYGTWEVANRWTTQHYVDYGAEGYDFGILLLKPDANGRFPGEYTGTFASFGNVALNAGLDVWRIGYPTEGPWLQPYYGGGNAQYYCRENFQEVKRNPAYGPVWLRFINKCPMNGGSSGGPNFVQFSDGSWGIVGVNNRGCGPCPGRGGWGDEAFDIWFDDTYLGFANAVLAQINGTTLSTRSLQNVDPGAMPAPG